MERASRPPPETNLTNRDYDTNFDEKPLAKSKFKSHYRLKLDLLFQYLTSVFGGGHFLGSHYPYKSENEWIEAYPDWPCVYCGKPDSKPGNHCDYCDTLQPIFKSI